MASSDRRSSRVESPRASRSAIVGAVLVLMAATAGSASAQTDAPKPRRWDLLVSSGTMVPTGEHRDAIKRGNLTAAQLSHAPHPAFAVNATVGWARSRDLGLDDDPRLDVFTYDIGGEVRGRAARLGAGFSASPFAGLGGGVRSYDYRNRAAEATHNLAAYASAGGELGKGRVRLRLELRDYLTDFRPLGGESGSELRNDVALLAGLRLTRR